MIAGIVERNPEGGLEAWITVSVLGIEGELQNRDVIVDTGFTGWLMLPESYIRLLGLVRAGNRRSVTASGEAESFTYYETWALWHGRLTWIEILQSIDQPLLGMELLQGSHFSMEAWEGGGVTIEQSETYLSP